MARPQDLRVLVVEDDDLNRNTLVEFLDMMGFEVIQANNGLHGLIKAKQEAPNLILLDIQMPRMDGLTFLNKMIEEDLNIPVIMTTALGREDDVKNAIKRGAKGYVVKPIDLNVLQERMGQVLKIEF